MTTATRPTPTDSASPADAALEQLELLEEQGNAAALQALAELYRAAAEERMARAALRDLTDRLQLQRAAHRRAVELAHAAAAIVPAGLKIWPGSPGKQPSAPDLRRDGGGYLKLSRYARECADGLDR